MTKEERKIWSKNYYTKNKEKEAEQARQRYIHNREKILLATKEYAKNNKDKVAVRTKKYREAHKQESSEYGKKYRGRNKKRISKRMSEYYLDTIVHQKARHKEYNKRTMKKQEEARLIRKYGVTPELYNKLFTQQDGRCLICDTPQSELNSSLHVDHNHVTGEVRGLLCRRCNLFLGNIGDDIQILLKAIEYLSKNK